MFCIYPIDEHDRKLYDCTSDRGTVRSTDDSTINGGSVIWSFERRKLYVDAIFNDPTSIADTCDLLDQPDMSITTNLAVMN
mmetsp:Transcript_23513/g.55719  ORF Transcript_23513/g.55719 Transcript_23513/m.55719 type:complete len:81 (+) Transcript_23513:985-1227(+)